MIGRLVIAIVLFTGIPVAHAEDEPKTKSVPIFKITSQLFARSVGFDKDGHCRAAGGVSLKAWHVPGFPAEIPHFESCTTISSPTTGGEVEFVFSIIDKDGERLQRVDGVMDLGKEGQVSQAVDWDHLKIPAAGIYYFAIKIEGREIGRYPMQFNSRKARHKRPGKKH
jgi:hypothetical protein